MYTMIISSLCFLSLVLQIRTQDVTVDTNVGTFVGTKSNITLGDKTLRVAMFLGIPYAEPPVGNLRFRVPVPKAPHSGSMKVQETSLRCIEMLPRFKRPESEDCLYLNIVVPEKFEFEMLPVMVWFHGGNFTRGSANGYLLYGLAGYGNVIVVSVNYRLNVWGFLSTEDSNSPGNYGLWDQRLALQWVKDNIEAFGGDNSRITIFGQSSGAASAIYQGLYPGNRGLFQRIIAQSGTAAATWSHTLTPKKHADELAKHVGCYNDDTAVIVDCLRNLNASVIDGAMNGDNNAPYFTFLPSIDNVFLACNPEDLLNPDKTSPTYQPSRETFASFDVLSGLNSGEGAMAFNPIYGYLDPETFLPNSSYFKDVLVRNFVYTAYYGRVKLSNISTAVDAIYNRYTDNNTVDDPYTIRERTADIFSDALFLAPLKRTLQIHTQLSTKSTYMYYLNVVPSYHALPTPSWFKKANHGDDIVFILPNIFTPFLIDEQEFELLELMVTLWTNFAKTGDPNSPTNKNISWSQYTGADPSYLELKRGTTSENIKEQLFEKRAEFWLDEMPDVIGYTSDTCPFILDTSGAHLALASSHLLFAFVVSLTSILIQSKWNI